MIKRLLWSINVRSMTNKMFTYSSDNIIEIQSLPVLNQQIKTDVENLKKLIEEGEKAKRKLEVLQNACKHEYFYDESGYPYYYRYCLSCGKFMYAI
jgi:predicted Rossmann fold nucleotide-binding protein DprA/Smf involved in DNA uptake